MLDHHLEPDEPRRPKFRYSDWDDFDEPSEEELRIAEHNYECLIYQEPEKRIRR